MRRRINSTERRRIERRHVAIRLSSGENGRKRMEARFDFGELTLPPDGRIVVGGF
jgi:hypothetical protein